MQLHWDCNVARGAGPKSNVAVWLGFRGIGVHKTPGINERPKHETPRHEIHRHDM